jgi:hypothetical protein
MATRTTTLKVIAMLTEAGLPRQVPMSEAGVEIYVMAWADVPDSHLEAACKQWIVEGSWFPVPAQLRNIAIGMMPDTSYLTPAEAWEEAVKCRSEFYPGMERSYHSPYPFVEKTIRAIGGLGMLKEATVEQTISHRSQFLAAYKTFVERAQADARLLPGVREFRDRLAAEHRAQIASPGQASVVHDVVKALASERRAP